MDASLGQHNIGPHTAIVQTLKRYGVVPIDFLAETLGSDSKEIEQYLLNLEEEGVVVRYDGKVVGLTQHDRGPLSAAG